MPAALQHVASRILIVRGCKVMLDHDLAELYGVATKRLNEQVKRNVARFPDEFMFRLTSDEAEALNRSHFATGSRKHRDPRFPPYAFTEHGALMAATLLNSVHAVEVSIYVVRAFVQLRETLAQNKHLAARLALLERRTEALVLKHDTFAADTRTQLKQVFEAIRELMAPPTSPAKRPIGFVP